MIVYSVIVFLNRKMVHYGYLISSACFFGIVTKPNEALIGILLLIILVIFTIQGMTEFFDPAGIPLAIAWYGTSFILSNIVSDSIR